MKAEMEEMQKKGPIAGAGGAADSSAYSFLSQFERTIDANSAQYKTSTSLGGWLEGRVRRSDVLLSAKLLYHLVRITISETLDSVWIQGRLTSC